MKSLIVTIAALTSLQLSAAPPLKIELIIPPEASIELAQDAFDAVAPIAEASKEKALLKGELTAEKRKQLRELEAVLAKGLTMAQGISLKLRITNTSQEPIDLLYGPDTSTNFLTLEGPDAINLPYDGAMTLDFRQPKATTIKAGQSKDFPIEELRYGQRDMSRWLIGQPGVYTIALRLVGRLNGEKFELNTEKVTLKVETKGS